MKVSRGSGGKDLHTLNSTEVTSQLLSNSKRPQQRYRVYCVHTT